MIWQYENIYEKMQIFNLSPEAAQAIKDFEGCHLTAYKDVGGVLTIGYGHTVGVRKGDKITQYCANMYFDLDVTYCEAQVNNLAVCKTQGQFDALVDFAFNLGMEKLNSSTLLRYIREGREAEEIQKEFLKWCHVGGKRVAGLVRRCEWRARQWVR